MIRRRFIYDIEIFPNFFYILFYDILNKKYFDFKLSDYENNITELVKFLSQDNILLIGFNNLKFDWPLLDYILFLYKKGYSISPSSIKQKANQVIKSSRKATNPSVLQCDLLLLNHFDNKAKIVSLKDLEFSMRMMNVQELPYPHNKILTLDEINTVKSYCYNDIDATYKLYEKSEKLLNGRFSLSYQYKTDMLSFNDPKVGEFILLDKLRKKLKKDYLGQTIRESIDISNIVFPYIEFQSEAFINLLEWLKQRTITDTKGMFTAIPLEEVEVLQPNINIVKYKKEYLKKLNVVYKGFEFTFGVGGIHGAEKGYFESNDEYVIKTCDVSSLYPNISIENNLYPEHLGNTFCEVYYDIYKERQKYDKGTPENLSLKLSLNGAYGKSNSEFSELRDSKFTMSITLNGQLLLSMLSERLMNIPNSKLIMINTDGLEIIIPRSEIDNYYRICKDWENLTRLELEYDTYDKIMIAHCNSYIGIFTNGKIKKKGAYETNPELHKNHSKLIVPKAVENYFTKGTPIEEFIKNHDDIFDFFLRVKLKEGSRLIATRGEEVIPLTKLTRYLVTNSGYTLLKLLSGDRTTNIEKGFLCTPCNYLTDEIITALKSDINYDYYIEKAQKLLVGEDDELEEN